ncbi:Insulinase (Peptidase family M16) protein [Thalictrum thalictroides]|uniref:Insulinase (Peptidase family M16) protein n=1 Tax=Thalictrum thalictroides TaxID=46969 RepID=A0A7J6W4V6_THATH|nr:Insulinase (Peptidase family M16) protein [Thalictrum thalictroides]
MPSNIEFGDQMVSSSASRSSRKRGVSKGAPPLPDGRKRLIKCEELRLPNEVDDNTRALSNDIGLQQYSSPQRVFSSTSYVIIEPTLIPPLNPNAMLCDRIAEQVESKIRLLDTDTRFTQYSSPQRVLIDHTNILSSPETLITTLPNGLRITTESNLATSTATVGV